MFFESLNHYHILSLNGLQPQAWCRLRLFFYAPKAGGCRWQQLLRVIERHQGWAFRPILAAVFCLSVASLSPFLGFLGARWVCLSNCLSVVTVTSRPWLCWGSLVSLSICAFRCVLLVRPFPWFFWGYLEQLWPRVSPIWILLSLLPVLFVSSLVSLGFLL